MRKLEPNPVQRPSLPPLFWVACCSWIGTLIAESASWQSFISEQGNKQLTVAGIPCLILICFFALVFFHLISGNWNHRKAARPWLIITKYGNTLLICTFAFAVSTFCASLFWSSWNSDVEILQQKLSSEDDISIELTSDPSMRDYGTVSVGSMQIDKHTCSIRIIWPDGTDPIFSGHSIIAKGNALAIEKDESGRWLHQNGYIATFKAMTVTDNGYAESFRGCIAQLRDRAFVPIASLNPDAAGLLSGILLGNKTLYQGTELEQAFKTTGLAHLMAVSGTHLAVVTVLISALLAKTPLKRKARSVILLVMLVIYVALTAMSASALRACTMCAIALIAGTFKRRKHVLNALALCVFIFLCLSPSIVFTLGFQLSVLAVLGLVIFGPLIQTWAQSIASSRFDIITSSVSATLAATLLTLPVTISQFAQLPIISPVANILAAPLITFVLSIGMMGTMVYFFIPAIGAIILHVAGIAAALCASLVRFIASVPFACIPVSGDPTLLAILFAGLAIMLWAFWPQPRYSQTNRLLQLCSSRALSFVFLIIPLFFVLMTSFGQSTHAISSSSRLIMLDVGQGDAIIIQSQGSTVLIDTGEKSDILSRELAEQGISALQAVVITHKDSDHCGALKTLSGVVQIDHVFIHEDLLDKEEAQDLCEAARWATKGRGAEGLALGSQLTIGEFTFTIISPEHGEQSNNAESLVGLLEYDSNADGSIEARGLLTGDAENEVLANCVNQIGDIDFLKVAHHGSKGGLTDEQLSLICPEIALISVGADNTYGHPSTSTLRQLENIGAKIYRTDKQGAITLGFSEHEISVTTELIS